MGRPLNPDDNLIELVSDYVEQTIPALPVVEYLLGNVEWVEGFRKLDKAKLTEYGTLDRELRRYFFEASKLDDEDVLHELFVLAVRTESKWQKGSQSK